MTSVRNKFFLCISELLTLILGQGCINALKFGGDSINAIGSIQNYFLYENNLCVVLEEPDKEVFLPRFHVPVVIYTRDRMLQDCGRKSKDQEDGYVFVTSNPANLEVEIVPLLKCVNQTTLKLKTKYILVLVISKDSNSSHYNAYSSFFLKLWEMFGIINIVILPVKDQSSSIILSYNPFLIGQHSNFSDALQINTLTQDVHGIMVDRFRNMHGHSLRTSFYTHFGNDLTLASLRKKHSLGADLSILFKQHLEEKLNVSFKMYEPLNKNILTSGNDTNTGLVGEMIQGRSEYCITFVLVPVSSAGMWSKYMQPILISYGVEIVFVVPKPRKIESWQLFQYIFTWQVSVGLCVVLTLLSGAALLFQFVHSNTSFLSPSGVSEVVSVWKAALSVSVNKLPTTHSQRLLIACSLLLSLIFITLISGQLFALIKEKPRLSSIKTFQDLHESNLPIYGTNKLFETYLDSFENTTVHNLKDNLKSDKQYEQTNFCTGKHLNITGRALVTTKDLIELVMRQYKNQVYSQYFEVIDETIFSGSLHVNLPMGSVYFDHFNKQMLRIRSAGIDLKWYDVFKEEYMKRCAAVQSIRKTDAPLESPQTDNHNEPSLTYDDLKLAFYTLYIGLTISVLSFLVEVCKC